ncbi:MAG: DUF3141 domain-containing protein, partial [Burkholderiales bacterium]|nr:DUF3141 domain-containing protein [Burkholderiales bacterium]
AKILRPMRLNYAMFSDKINPAMKVFEELAIQAEKHRVKLDKYNHYLELQNEMANLITNNIRNFRHLRDNLQEQIFFNIWGNSFVQKFWGTYKTKPRHTPSTTILDRKELLTNFAYEIKKNIPIKNDVEAFLRYVIMIINKNNSFTDKFAQTLIKQAHSIEPKFSRDKIYNIIKNQAMVVIYDNKEALPALKKYLTNKSDIQTLSEQVKAIAKQIDELPLGTEKYAHDILNYLLAM